MKTNTQKKWATGGGSYRHALEISGSLKKNGMDLRCWTHQWRCAWTSLCFQYVAIKFNTKRMECYIGPRLLLLRAHIIGRLHNASPFTCFGLCTFGSTLRRIRRTIFETCILSFVLSLLSFAFCPWFLVLCRWSIVLCDASFVYCRVYPGLCALCASSLTGVRE